MKPRTIKTSKLLVVALGAAAGCAPAVNGDGGAQVQAHAERAPAPTALVAPSEAAPIAVLPPRPASSEDPKLLALRDGLLAEKPGVSLAKIARFRPLCDERGYPLVGNLMRKAPDPGDQPSAFCADVRAHAAQAKR